MHGPVSTWLPALIMTQSRAGASWALHRRLQAHLSDSYSRPKSAHSFMTGGVLLRRIGDATGDGRRPGDGGAPANPPVGWKAGDIEPGERGDLLPEDAGDFGDFGGDLGDLDCLGMTSVSLTRTSLSSKTRSALGGTTYSPSSSCSPPFLYAHGDATVNSTCSEHGERFGSTVQGVQVQRVPYA